MPSITSNTSIVINGVPRALAGGFYLNGVKILESATSFTYVFDGTAYTDASGDRHLVNSGTSGDDITLKSSTGMLWYNRDKYIDTGFAPDLTRPFTISYQQTYANLDRLNGVNKGIGGRFYFGLNNNDRIIASVENLYYVDFPMVVGQMYSVDWVWDGVSTTSSIYVDTVLIDDQVPIEPNRAYDLPIYLGALNNSPASLFIDGIKRSDYWVTEALSQQQIIDKHNSPERYLYRENGQLKSDILQTPQALLDLQAGIGFAYLYNEPFTSGSTVYNLGDLSEKTIVNYNYLMRSSLELDSTGYQTALLVSDTKGKPISIADINVSSQTFEDAQAQFWNENGLSLNDLDGEYYLTKDGINPIERGKTLITNGYFKTDLTGWSVQNAVAALTTFAGQNCVAVADGGSWSAIKQVVDTVAGQYYEFYCKRHAVGGSNNSNVLVYDGDLTGVEISATGDIVSETDQNTSNSWVNCYCKFQAISDKTTITLNSSSTNTAYFTDVSLHKSLIDPLVAHRGFKTYRPENTMAAFTNAFSLGAKIMETDLQVSSDDQVVLIHDDTVDRTTNGTGNVKDLTLAELKALDAGSWFNAAYAGEQIPTFDELLQYADANGIALFPEIKNYRTISDIDLMLAVRNNYPNVEITWLSFRDEDLVYLRDAGCNDKVGFLKGTSSISNAVLVGNAVLSLRDTTLTRGVIINAKNLGVGLSAWTVTTEAFARELMHRGVDQITTDVALIDPLP
jgi:glycerophosphoryl diester phosphodiesterase